MHRVRCRWKPSHLLHLQSLRENNIKRLPCKLLGIQHMLQFEFVPWGVAGVTRSKLSKCPKRCSTVSSGFSVYWDEFRAIGRIPGHSTNRTNLRQHVAVSASIINKIKNMLDTPGSPSRVTAGGSLGPQKSPARSPIKTQQSQLNIFLFIHYQFSLAK